TLSVTILTVIDYLPSASRTVTAMAPGPAYVPTTGLIVDL
ncbi:unnamed protein product, partial [marine sediment metagenome]